VAVHGEPSTATVGDDALRSALHQMWASVAPAWAEQAAYVDARGAVVAQAMLDAARPRPGDRVLELACGAGGVGLAAAERVGPTGSVVLSDVAGEMVAVASARAVARGLGNVSIRQLDLERIDEPDASYDVVVCREGLMLVPDPARAAREMRRVLRPAGRAAVAAWGPRQHNPWLGALFDAVSTHTGLPVPPPGIPGPFSLDDAEALAALLSDAELADVAVTETPTPLHVSSFEEWWTVVPSLAGPIANVLASLPQDVQQAIRATASEALERHSTPNGYHIPGLSLIGTGRCA
jgi:ubiquinone/menaquinone biosynthesis C-methylase UbiE